MNRAILLGAATAIVFFGSWYAPEQRYLYWLLGFIGLVGTFAAWKGDREDR